MLNIALLQARLPQVWGRAVKDEKLKEPAAPDLSFKSPLPVLAPPSIAIVGASERAKWPSLIFRNLCAFKYPGKIYPVNPRANEVWGEKCYPDLASLPEPPAHALLIIPAQVVQAVLETGVAA